jgi:hypothetical protein
LLLTGGMSAQAQSFSNAVVALNPVAYWPLTESVTPGSAPTVVQNYGTLGAAENGNLSGNVVSGPGPVAGALANGFDGLQSAAGAWIVSPYAGTRPSTPPFTIEAWLNTFYPAAGGPQQTGSKQQIVISDMSLTRAGWVLYENVNQDSGEYSFRAFIGGGNHYNLSLNLGPSGSVRAGQWTHLVIVVDATTNVTAYTNGVIAGTGSATTSYLPNDGAAGVYGLTIATRSDNLTTYNWAGGVAEVAYYTNALALSDVQADYNARNDAATYASLVLGRNPVIYYKLDQQASQPVANNYGSLGAAANGYYPTTASPGAAGPALGGFPSPSLACQFNGGQSSSTGPGLPCGGGNPAMFSINGSLSVMAWVQVPSGPVGWIQDVIGRSDGSFRAVVDTSGLPHFADSADPNLIGANPVNDGAWHFWVATYSSASSSAALYIDGVQMATATYSPPAVGVNELLIGGAPDYAGRNFVGNIAQVAIFTNALTQTQVQNLVLAANPVIPPPVLSQPVFPYSYAQCWLNSTYVFKPVVTDISGATLFYQWQLNSGSGPVNIPGATNANLAFLGIPGLAVGNTYTLSMTASNVHGAASSSVQFLVMAPPTVAWTNYYDSFSRAGALNGSQPNVDPAGSAWLADSSFTCNGAVCTNATTVNNAAFLPFNPKPGHVYVLSCDLNPPSGTSGNWEALGYAIGNVTVGQAVNNNGTWLLARDSRGDQMFNGPVTSGGGTTTPYNASGPSTYQIVLDTTTGDASSGWTVSFWENGILQQGPATFTGSNPAYTGIFFENYLLGSDTWDNLLLTDSVIPVGVPSIVQDVPSQEFVLHDGTVSIPFQAFATASISYQWQFNGNNLANSARITGAQTNILSIANVQASDTGSYQVIATDSAGSVTSSVSTLIVGTLPLSFNGTNGVAWAGNSMSGAYTTPFLDNNVLTLTDGGQSQVRTFFFQFPQYIGAFQAAFTYQDVGGVGSGVVADGASFILQNDPRGPAAVVGPGNSLGVMGYPGAVANISPSAELVFNIYSPVGYSWNINGDVTTPAQTAPGSVKLTLGNPINVTLLYANGQLALTMTDTVTLDSFSTNLNVGDLTSVLGASTAYVGFGGSAGFYTSTQIISGFSFNSLPPLAVALTATNTAVISWAAAAGGFTLQQNSDLSTTNWVNVTNLETVVNGQNQVIVPAGSGKESFRLVQQQP